MLVQIQTSAHRRLFVNISGGSIARSRRLLAHKPPCSNYWKAWLQTKNFLLRTRGKDLNRYPTVKVKLSQVIELCFGAMLKLLFIEPVQSCGICCTITLIILLWCCVIDLKGGNLLKLWKPLASCLAFDCTNNLGHLSCHFPWGLLYGASPLYLRNLFLSSYVMLCMMNESHAKIWCEAQHGRDSVWTQTPELEWWAQVGLKRLLE